MWRFLLFIGFLLLYYFTSFSKVPFGDCIGFVVDIEKNQWITKISASSHFLYINIAIALKRLLPFLTSIEVGRLLSVVSGALCVSLLYNLLNTLEGNRYWKIAVCLLLGLSFTLWRNAVNLEVYSFNTVFVILFLTALVKSWKTGNKIVYMVLGCILGISLMSHIQNIFFLPSLLVLAYFRWSKDGYACLVPLACTGFFLGGIFAFNHFQQLSSDQVMMANSSWVQNTFRKEIMEYAQDVLKAIAYMVYNFWFFLPFAFYGFYVLWRNHNKLSWILLPSLLINLGFATFYAVTDNYNYFIPCYVIMSVYLFVGLSYSKVGVKYAKALFLLPVVFPLLYLTSYQISKRTLTGQEFAAKKAYKGGLNYYLLPWLNNNVGILEFTILNQKAPEPIYWMTESAEEYLQLVKHKYSITEIQNQ